ncbi:DEKNAAC102415 [Brettanomyces naardenensis]|uniref:DEKNAAC102415 n=1 Tax=Brettanomyces naardenensis TaxID=13370 RepID=A0A448YL86_BRENA|nr:DEKNAAC102415 [Brettanomyces naardenensis]
MSLCRGQFFFISNSSILNVGLKRSLRYPLGGLKQYASVTGSSRSAAISHYVKRFFSPDAKANRSFMSTLPEGSKENPSVNVSGKFSSPAAASSLFHSVSGPQKRMFSTSAISRLRSSFTSFSAGAGAGAGASATESLNGSKWPVNTAKPIGYLCIGCSILVFAIVVLGGLTRLTESGLSITEWKPVTGAIPPLSEEDWQAEFDKYQESPEFKELNTDMNLQEYKFIYSMEWSHRLLGRIIGALFVLPTLYYVARRKVSPPTAFKLLGICGLLGLQGFVGWWMVYSGIDRQQLDARRSKPTVSPYRLATHLAVAFTVYCCMISTGFSVLRDHKIMAHPEEYQKIFQQIGSPALRRFKGLATGLFGLVFITAMTGALVAGLDAGMIYNTFPKMGEGYIPPTSELMDPLFARKEDKSDLWWRNMLENPTTVQLNHRIMAVTTFCSVVAMHLYARSIKPIIPRKAYAWTNVSVGLATLQLTLGICTLLWIVPTDLGAAHQAGALALLTGVLMMVNNLKRPSKSNLLLLKKFLQKAAKESSQKPLQ